MAFMLTVIISCSQLLIIQVHIAALTSKVSTVIIPTDELGSCLSAENREITLLSIRSNISVILLGLYAAVPQCGDGLWYRVAYLNMNDSSQQCPPNWMEIDTPIRACGRPTSTRASCPSEYFSTGHGSLQYSKVCGRAIGYQNGSTDSFARISPGLGTIIDDPYVDGVSVTHGIPHNHIWTFSTGASEARVANYTTNCPCANPAADSIPAPNFVGDNYFCESGNPGEGLSSGGIIFENVPVWDGEQCESECRSNGKSPPWFNVTLPNPTSDDIEVRVCGDEGTSNEDTPIQLLEIYVQ